MTALPLTQAIENVYTSLHDSNRDIDAHIAALKDAMTAEGKKEAIFDPSRLATPNREGRKRMEAYFRQRGVTVSFQKK
jgi:hypothetical protein